MPLTFQQSHTLQMLEAELQLLYTQDDRLDQRAQNSIAAVGIVLAVLDVFGQLIQPERPFLTTLGVIAVLVACLLSLLLSFYVLLPKRWIARPIPEAGDIIPLLRRNEAAYYWLMLDEHLKAIAQNRSVVLLKSRVVSMSTALIGFAVVTILILAAF
jgi:hypothetical protein